MIFGYIIQIYTSYVGVVFFKLIHECKTGSGLIKVNFRALRIPNLKSLMIMSSQFNKKL